MIMPFGKHKGKDISEIPGEYLQWTIQNLEFRDPRLKQAIQRELSGEASADRTNAAMKDHLINELRAQVVDLKTTCTSLRARIYQLENYGIRAKFDDWYLKVVRIAHPDRGGDPAVMQMINELKDHVEK